MNVILCSVDSLTNVAARTRASIHLIGLFAAIPREIRIREYKTVGGVAGDLIGLMMVRSSNGPACRPSLGMSGLGRARSGMAKGTVPLRPARQRARAPSEGNTAHHTSRSSWRRRRIARFGFVARNGVRRGGGEERRTCASTSAHGAPHDPRIMAMAECWSMTWHEGECVGG